MNQTSMFKKLLNSNKIEFIMEAHNGISAKIVEEAGFKGIWGSGLTISASLGVRDNNEASWTQILDVVEFMSDCASIPILLDGDTGFGNFNNVRRLVKKLEQRGIAGVCIEDKIFPKTNSFIKGEQQPLADIEEFCGRIQAGKDTQTKNDFCIIARVEAFIAGWGLNEALKRAYAYAEAGADAILIHSKLSVPDDIFNFLENWDNRKPIVIVPTMYYRTPTDQFEKAGVSLIIWANQILRGSVTVMQKLARQIQKDRKLVNIENKIVPVSEIFRLQNVEEYKLAEERYTPQAQNIKAVILAASKGENFGALTLDKPKCMIEVLGKSILSSQIETLNNCKIKDISVVVGYKKENVNLPNIKYIENPHYENYSILYSYYVASAQLTGPCIFTFGDILFEHYVFQDFMNTAGDIVLAVDTSWWQGDKNDREIDMVICEKPPSDNYLSDRCVTIKEIGVHLRRANAHGEWIGLMKLSRVGLEVFKTELERFHAAQEEVFYKTDINEFLIRLIKKGIDVKACYFRGHWLDVDSLDDIPFIQNLAKSTPFAT